MTSIRYSLSLDAGVRLRVVSPTGREIRTLVDGVESRGDHLTIWDGRDNNGQRVAAGVYLLRLEIEGQAANQKLIVVR
jgi:flagellar hook assembly protein FlgD